MTSPLAKSPRPPATVAQFPAERLGDAELVNLASQGDAKAIGVIWDRYAAMVRRVLAGALGPDSAIEDLLQEVFIAFLKGAGRIENASALRGYLTGVAIRQAALELRRRKVRRLVMLTPNGQLPDPPASPLDSEAREALRAFYRVLDQLSQRERMVFVLRHVEGLEYAQIVEHLGISESTARRTLNSAREQLERAVVREPALRGYLKFQGGERP
ncbi:MAG TPA: sigma-70 family RNA polymerase sigma factor [Polyangiaceae bacterium]